MTTNLSTRRSAFMLRRPLITSNGFTSDLDATIKSHLTELNSILGKHVFNPLEDDDVYFDSYETKTALKSTASDKKVAASTATSNESKQSGALYLRETLEKKIYAKKTQKEEIWDSRGLLHEIIGTKLHNLSSISDCIDQNKVLSNLKYEYQEYLNENWNILNNHHKAILGFQNISDYLIAYAYLKRGISDVNALNNFINNRKDGLATIVNYAIISSTRTIIQKESLNIQPATIKKVLYTYNDDEHPLIEQVINSKLSFNHTTFSKSLNKIIDNFIYNGHETDLINLADIGEIPQEYYPLLIKYIRTSPIPITEMNINYFLPFYINQIKSTTFFKEEADEIVDEELDKDFEVSFFENDKASLQANVSNVKCAANLFYSMVVGEELEVFNMMNYFTHKFLVKNRVDIQDPKLRENIQLYVFSNKFKDLETGRILERTRAAERQMFYRQVFNIGNAPVTEDMIVNSDFSSLWKTLILEADDYLVKAQASSNPDSYVSRQNVMQAVEEIQYNLSSNCTGMATVISPMIYSELNFVVNKIFSHPEIIRQVAPANGTWWRVIETLYAQMKQRRLNAMVTYNKAKLCYSIIKKIANYNPSTFEQDKEFSSFISDVNALISTQSILQENAKRDRHGRMDDSKIADEEENTTSDNYKVSSPAAGNDEWDFE